MDNVGNYVTRGQLLVEFVNASLATSSTIVLSGKAITVAPEATFTFSPASPTPAIGDFIVYGTASSTITNVAGTVITVDDATDIPNGVAKLIKTSYLGTDIDSLIADAMAFIDRHTRQWFNKRTLNVSIEGTNSKLLQFGIPIIEITSLKKNGESNVLDPSWYRVFNSREYPDDRRNPKIELLASIGTDFLEVDAGYFARGTQTVIAGSFGFLEPDGSTPRMIQRATLKLATRYALNTPGATASTGSLGPVKREKTDMHEIEYFDPRGTKGSSLSEGSGLSGDDEIDDIIAAYKSPILIGGSFPDIGKEVPILYSFNRGE